MDVLPEKKAESHWRWIACGCKHFLPITRGLMRKLWSSKSYSRAMDVTETGYLEEST